MKILEIFAEGNAQGEKHKKIEKEQYKKGRELLLRIVAMLTKMAQVTT